MIAFPLLAEPEPDIARGPKNYQEVESLPASFESCLKAEQLGWHRYVWRGGKRHGFAPLRYGEGICAERDYKIARHVWRTPGYGAASAGHRTSIGRIERFTDRVRDRAGANNRRLGHDQANDADRSKTACHRCRPTHSYRPEDGSWLRLDRSGSQSPREAPARPPERRHIAGRVLSHLPDRLRAEH